MVQQKHIQVTVHVVIEEDGLGAETRKVQSIFGCFILISGNTLPIQALANEQLVFAVEGLVIAHAADINIEQSIVVDVYYGYACAPSSVFRDFGPVGHIFKLHSRAVQVDLVGSLIGGEEEVHQAIVVEIARTNSRPI